MAQVISAGSRRGRGKAVKDRSLGKVKRSWEVRKEQREMWAAALDLYLSLEGSSASGRAAMGATAARAVSEELPVQATAVSCCGITDMNNTITVKPPLRRCNPSAKIYRLVEDIVILIQDIILHKPLIQSTLLLSLLL
jgi:hypothetical protein